MDRRIIVRIYAGLGNQMYQYAAARALSLQLKVPLSLDLSWFPAQTGQFTRREFGLGGFRLAATEITPAQFSEIASSGLDLRFGLRTVAEIVSIVREPPGAIYWSGISRIRVPALLIGYWQSPRYFEAIADTIRADFAFPELPSAQGQELAAVIRETPNAVAVHIRRGDYVTRPSAQVMFGGVCTPEYYAAAIDRLAADVGDLHLFLFSDEPEWLASNFDTRGHPSTVVAVPEHATAAQHDIHLMSLARHHIIANSTFSWWGAWLSRTDGKRFAPRRWMANEPEPKPGDRIPESWTTI